MTPSSTKPIRLTPLEQLISDKQRLEEACRVHEQKLSDDFSYVQENAGSLILSGISSMLFPSAKSNTKKEASPGIMASAASAATHSLSLGLSDYLSIAKGIFPFAWDIAQPFLFTWGIKKAKNWFTHLLFRKKK